MKINHTGIRHHMALVRKYQRKMTHEELLALIQKAQAGDREAMDKIVMSNLALVIDIAKRYVGLAPLEDIVQMGILGLYDAVRRYDPSREYRFSTYAYYWIRQRITEGITEYQNPIHLPRELHNVRYRLRAVRNEEPCDEELAKVNVTRRQYVRLKKAAYAVPMPEPLDDSRESWDNIVGGMEDDGYSEVEKREQARQIIALAKELLTEQQYRIFLSYYLDGRKPKEIASEHGVTHQAISRTLREIRKKIMEKINA